MWLKLKAPLLALAFAALGLGISPPVQATVPCPVGLEVAALKLESVTVDGAVQTDVSAYTKYNVQLQAGYGTEGVVLRANALNYVTEEYGNAP